MSVDRKGCPDRYRYVGIARSHGAGSVEEADGGALSRNDKRLSAAGEVEVLVDREPRLETTDEVKAVVDEPKRQHSTCDEREVIDHTHRHRGEEQLGLRKIEFSLLQHHR